MKVIQGIENITKNFKGCALTIGNFDGVHCGHRELIKRICKRAKEKNTKSLVMTFDPHPMKILFPDKHLHRLFDFQDQLEVLSQLGVNAVIVEKFNKELSRLSPSGFIEKFIVDPIQPEFLVIGYDFKFGANRHGNAEYLLDIGKKRGFNVEVVPAFKIDGQIVSSTSIKEELIQGDVSHASKMLGRNYYLRGKVVNGEKRGSRVGFPTANLETDAEILPLNGVYATFIEVNSQKYRAVTNIGYKPTFRNEKEGRPTIESHIINFSGDIYGKEIKVHFGEFLRQELKFSGPAALKEQIATDIIQAQKWFENSEF